MQIKAPQLDVDKLRVVSLTQILIVTRLNLFATGT